MAIQDHAVRAGVSINGMEKGGYQNKTMKKLSELVSNRDMSNMKKQKLIMSVDLK